ncbi:MAG: hypothetical protein FK734_14655 [Asgard group archaeon]|nr:hypothetical protein [Asgard group archaeon]
MQKWIQALNQFLGKIYQQSHMEKIDWAIIGSGATYLQGCNIKPNDIDILVKNPESVEIIAYMLEDYYKSSESKSNTIQGEESEELWLSTKDKPVDISVDDWNFKWVFSRVLIGNIKVETAHITAPQDHFLLTTGIWEAGPKIWPYIKFVNYQGYSIPVIPLEIQLATNINRGLEDRSNEIIAILKRDGFNLELLKESLTSDSFNAIQNKLF